MRASTETVHQGARSRTRLLALPLAGLLVVGSVVAASWTVAEIALVGVRTTLDTWVAAEEVQTLAEWEDTQSQLDFAMTLLPDSSEHYGLRGLLNEWRFFIVDSPVETEGDIIRFRQDAIDSYRRAAVLRPAWPAGWAELARQKAMLGQEDEELLEALERALMLGPNEEGVRLLVTEVATLIWPYLAENPPTRDKVVASITATLTPPQTDAMLPHLIYITERNMQSELCPLLPVDQLVEWAQEACALPE
jgi:hypothetical protein